MEEKNVQAISERLEELTNDSAFMEKLSMLDGLEEVAKAITDAGVETSVDDVKAMLSMVKKTNADGELGIDNLDNVSGGAMSGYDFVWNCGRACVNYGIMIGNRIFKNNAPYV